MTNCIDMKIITLFIQNHNEGDFFTNKRFPVIATFNQEMYSKYIIYINGWRRLYGVWNNGASK